jgi:hypothetical protein
MNSWKKKKKKKNRKREKAANKDLEGKNEKKR